MSLFMLTVQNTTINRLGHVAKKAHVFGNFQVFAKIEDAEYYHPILCK